MRPVRSFACFGLVAILSLAGCGGGNKTPDASNIAAPAANAAAPAPQETGAPAGNKVISHEAGEVEFRYSWPQQAASIPELDSWLSGNGERLKKQTFDGARSEQEAAKKDDYEFRGHSYSEDWHSVADLPALLVMQSDGYSFTGGAHGMPIVTTLFWDKAAKKRLATDQIFDMPALTATLKDRFCKALDAERSERRGEPVDSNDPNELSEFVQCVDLARQTILPVALEGGALDTVRVVVMPYEAGPYSEGIYELDLPVDAAVFKAVKPAWRGSFSAGS